MSVSNGPGIVTSGLVFHYDMGNTGKSYIGQPTTNLSYNNGQGNSEYLNSPQTWTNSGAWSLSSNETDIPLPNFPHAGSLPSNLRILSGVITSASTQGCQFGCGYTTVSPSTTYTMSVYYRQNRAMANNAMPYLRTNVNNNSIASFSYNGNYSQWTWPVNQWIRISATGTTQGNENGLYLSQYFGEFVGDKIWMCGHQVEAVSYATPLVAGTRSASQAIVDLTSNNTITANSLTYNNDNTFSFNGGSHLSIPNSSAFNMTTGLTLEAWVKFDGNSDDFIFEKGDVNTQYSLFSHGDDVVFRTYHTGDGGYHTQNPSKASVGVTNGQWVHITGSWDGSYKRIFINGQLKNEVAKTGALVTTSLGSSVGRFGGNTTGYYFNGSIAVVRVYDKGLSASEVQKNFSATRGRYGI